MFVRNFTTSLSIAEILLFIKRWSKIDVANIANNNACVMLTPTDIDASALCVSVYVNFCITKNKTVISREDRMLTKVLHQEKGSKKLLAEFPNKSV